MLTYKDLIDVAIGTPESGHVNFYALHVLLTSFAQKLDCLYEVVEHDNEHLMLNAIRLQSSLMGKSSRYRLGGGADEEAASAAPAAEPAAEEAVPAAEEVAEQAAPAEPEVAPEQTAPAEPEVAPDAAPAPEPEIAAAPEPAVEETVEQAAEPAKEAAPEAAAAEKAEHVLEAVTPKSKSPTAGTPTSNRPEALSRHSSRDLKPSGDFAGFINKLEKRMSRMELQKEQSSIELQQFVNNLTSQLHLTMNQLNNVTHMLLDQDTDMQRVKTLRKCARQLRAMMEAGLYECSSTSWQSHEMLAEEFEAEETAVEDDMVSTASTEKAKSEEESLDLEQQVCYTPERMLNEVLQLKSDLCELTNKINELSAALLKQDAQRTMARVMELSELMRDMRMSNATNKELLDNLAARMDYAANNITQLKQAIAHLDSVKTDKSEVELLLAEKVDFAQLKTKVSHEQLDLFKERLEKQFCEMRSVVGRNERNVLQIIDGLRMSLGIDALELSLKDFRELIEQRVIMIAEALRKYMEMTNDDCAAAAGRVKVMQDLSCLSCDTPCVMRTVERSKLPVPASTKASSGIAPIVTYELGQIRKSGIMGYYRKDEFPHTCQAWTQGTSKMPMNKCVPRHAGGLHTVHTAEEHQKKVVMSKKNAGW